MSDKQPRDGPKIGAGHAAGMLRQGLKELRGALYPESNVAQPTDLGIYGGATPQEVYDSRQPDGPGRAGTRTRSRRRRGGSRS